eukprot:1767878-Amphidinium_carterae.1
MDDVLDAETVFADSDCEREAYDYTDFPHTTALLGFDLERGHQGSHYGADSGAICNSTDVHTMTLQHLNEAQLAEVPGILLPPEELDFPLGSLMCDRVRKAILNANSKQRWWQQVGSSPVSSPRTPESRACGRTSTLGESMESLDPFATYPILSTGMSVWREGGGKQLSQKRQSPLVRRQTPPILGTATSEWRSPLPEDDACDIDDIRFAYPDLLQLALPVPVNIGATECSRSIQLVRLSSLAKYRNRGGWSHLYRINHHPIHTFDDLGRLMASVLKTSRRKLCFFARTYVEAQNILNLSPAGLHSAA